MTWLSKVVFDTRAKQVRHDFADVEALHRSIMSMFPDVSDRRALGVLFRAETSSSNPHLLVQSAVEPSLVPPEGYIRTGSKNLYEPLRAVVPGRNLRFRTLVAPYKSLPPAESSDGVLRRRGAKVPVAVSDVPDWLGKQLSVAGTIHGLSISEKVLPVRSKTQRSLPSHAILADGILRVTNAAELSQLVATGLGRLRAFGCGMLSLAPA